jgi:hypothetical protein
LGISVKVSLFPRILPTHAMVGEKRKTSFGNCVSAVFVRKRVVFFWQNARKGHPADRRDAIMLMRHPHPELQFTHLIPFGALIRDQGVQFVVFSRSATAMRLLVYDDVSDRDPVDVIEFDRDTDRWGDIWSIYLKGAKARDSCTIFRRMDRMIRNGGCGSTVGRG